MADSSAMFSLDFWDLAPGEAISQSLPVRALHGSLAPLCPAPTLDSDEFLAQTGVGEDCSSVDSLAEYGLAPGEVRSQSPFRAFQGSEPQRCPPPTLDTEEFEDNIESQDPWIVEDSQAGPDLARGECRAQGPASDFADAGNQFCPPSLDTRETENNRVITDNVLFVEDSQAPWDLAKGEARREGSGRHLNDFKSKCFPSLGNAPDTTVRSPNKSEHLVVRQSNPAPVNCEIGSNSAKPLISSFGKRGLSHCTPQGDSGEYKKQAKLEAGANFFDDLDSNHLPASSSGRFFSTESSVEQNRGLPKQVNCGLVTLSPPEHALPTPVPPTISDNVENGFRKTSQARRFTPTDVTTSTVANSRSTKALHSKTQTRESPTEKLADSCKNLRSEGVFSTSRDNISENHKVLTSTVRHLDKDGVLPAPDEVGCRMKDTEVDPPSLGKKAGRGALAKPKVQSSFGFQAKSSRKVVQKELERDPEEWLCPKAGKRFRPRPKQLSMDRYESSPIPYMWTHKPAASFSVNICL